MVYFAEAPSVDEENEAALLFIAQGYRVVNIARRSTENEAIVDINCDMSRPDAIGAIESRLAQEFAAAEQICLVHNACRMLKDSVRDCDGDAMRGIEIVIHAAG